MPDDYEYGPAPSGSIVVGHDGSKHAFRALAEAITLAEAFRAPLVIVRAWELDKHVPAYTQILSSADSFPETTDTVRSALKYECEPALSAHPSIAFSFEAALGAPAKVLTSFSAQARLLVLGTRGLGGVAGLLLGSVADRCLHQASCPVLVVRPPANDEAETSPTDENLIPDHWPSVNVEPGSVVVGHDGSANSNPAITVAFEFAKHLGVPLTAVRTWSINSPPHKLLWQDGYVASFSEVSLGVRDQLIADIADLSEQYGMVPVSYFGVLGGAGDTLVRASNNAAALVLGRRGRGGFRSLLLGSVSAYCAHRASCPTLVVP